MHGAALVQSMVSRLTVKLDYESQTSRALSNFFAALCCTATFHHLQNPILTPLNNPFFVSSIWIQCVAHF